MARQKQALGCGMGGVGGYNLAGKVMGKPTYDKDKSRDKPRDKDKEKDKEEKSSSHQPPRHKEPIMLSKQAAVAKMSSYLNHLADVSRRRGDAIHVKQARQDCLVKLSRALQSRGDLLEALKVACPRLNEQQRFKTATALLRGLANHMRKQALGLGGDEGMMGAAGGLTQAAGGDVNTAPAALGMPPQPMPQPAGASGMGAGGALGMAPPPGVMSGPSGSQTAPRA